MTPFSGSKMQGYFVSQYFSKRETMAFVGKTIPDEESPLYTAYTEIAEKSLLLEDEWPASQSFCKFLEKTPNRHYEVPSFPENGPVILLAFLDEKLNTTARFWLRECLQLFDDFCSKDLGKGSAWIPAKVPHVCVTVFQEHPSLLPEEQQKSFRPIDTPTMNQLIRALDKDISAASKISLRLAALLFTPDGALIAGCVPCTSRDDQAFQRLRQHSAQAAGETIGGTTSRPKSLIHVTLGRVLSIVNNNSSSCALVERYNREILPGLVRSIKEKKADVWTMEHLTLLRNTRWLCEENEIYRSWTLDD